MHDKKTTSKLIVNLTDYIVSNILSTGIFLYFSVTSYFCVTSLNDNIFLYKSNYIFFFDYQKKIIHILYEVYILG